MKNEVKSRKVYEKCFTINCVCYNCINMVNSLIVIERLSITSWYQNRQLSLQNETTIVAECECAEGYEGSDCGDEGWCPSHFPLFLFFSYYIKGQIRVSYINCETCLLLIYRMSTKLFL